MDKIIQELKLLAAAYEMALNFDYCPDIENAKTFRENYMRTFSNKEYIKAAEEHQGSRPSEIADEMVRKIAGMTKEEDNDDEGTEPSYCLNCQGELADSLFERDFCDDCEMMLRPLRYQ